MSNFLLVANPDWSSATTDWDSGQWQTGNINWVDDTVYGTPGTDSYTISEVVGEIRFWNGDGIIHQSNSTSGFTGQVILNDNVYEADKLYRLNFKIGTGSSSSRTADWFVKVGYMDGSTFVEMTPQADNSPTHYTWSGTVNEDENLQDTSGGRVIDDGADNSDWSSYYSTAIDSVAVGKKVAIQLGIVSGNSWAGFGNDMELLSMPLPKATTSMVNSFEVGDLQELISTNPDVWADIALPNNGSSSNLPDTTTNPLTALTTNGRTLVCKPITLQEPLIQRMWME